MACQDANQVANQVPNYLHRPTASEYHSPFFSSHPRPLPKSLSYSNQPLPTRSLPKHSLLHAIHPNQHAHLPPHCPADCRTPLRPISSLPWSNLPAQPRVQPPYTSPKNSGHAAPTRYGPAHDTTSSESSCNPYSHQTRRSAT